MSSRIISNPVRVWNFLNLHGATVPAIAGMKGIGLERDGELVAGVLYESCNDVNIWMHTAIAPNAHVTKRFVWYSFYYPFVELGCKRVSGYVEASNLAARRLDEHLGFKQEAVLRGAARDGGDVILYVMWRDECRFLKADDYGRQS